MMDHVGGRTEARVGFDADQAPILSQDTRRHLGLTLRSVYAQSCDAAPVPDAQIDLLLRLRHKERDRLRSV